MFITNDAGDVLIGGSPEELRWIGLQVRAVACTSGGVVLTGFGQPPPWAQGKLIAALVVRVAGELRAYVDAEERQVIEGGSSELQRIAEECCYPDDVPQGVHSHLIYTVDSWTSDSDNVTLVQAESPEADCRRATPIGPSLIP